MKAILLAGGMGTRLRPLTAHTPKPIVPIFNRPFLHYQLDLLKQVPEIDEAILSLNYQPQRIEEVLGDGSSIGVPLRYVVEPDPLGTGGAIKYASTGVTDTVVVFNGDVLTQIDLAAVIRLHRERRARATIVLTPVDNPIGLWPRRNRPGRQRQALSREAERRQHHDEQHQRRHLRARARDVRPHSERCPVVDRTGLLSLAGRTRRDVRRLPLRWVLDRHRCAGQVHPGAPRHHGRQVCCRTVSEHGCAPHIRLADRADLQRRHDRRSLFH